MTSEINSITNRPSPIKTATKAGIEGEQKVAVTQIEKNDSVALTATALEIKKSFGSSSASPVDTDRVNSIKKALADGSYSINAEKVAKKMLQFEMLMPQENSPST